MCEWGIASSHSLLWCDMNSRVIMFNYKIIAYAMIILTMIKVMKSTNTHSCAHVLVNKEIKSQKVFACAHIPYSGVIKCTSIDPLLINDWSNLVFVFRSLAVLFCHWAVIFNLHIEIFSTVIIYINLFRSGERKQTCGLVPHSVDASLSQMISHNFSKTVSFWNYSNLTHF